jgi:hypothetical protein
MVGKSDEPCAANQSMAGGCLPSEFGIEVNSVEVQKSQHPLASISGALDLPWLREPGDASLWVLDEQGIPKLLVPWLRV